MRRLTVLLLALCLLCPTALHASAEESKTAEALLSEVAAHCGYASVAQWAEEGLPSQLRSHSGEWYLLALRGLGGYSLDACAQALSDAASASPSLPAVTEQKRALALVAAGQNGHPWVFKIHKENGQKQGVMSLIWGLILNGSLPESREDSALAATLLSDLLALQGEDGGWALQKDRASDPDVTAMALQALSFYRENAESEIKRGLSCLASLQKPSGGFSSYGVENAESAAQVILALCALGIDPACAEGLQASPSVVDAMRSFACEGGGFSHIADGERSEMATAQALLAILACERLENKEAFVFDFSSDLPQSTEIPAQTEDASTVAVPHRTDNAQTDLRPMLIAVILAAALIALVLLFATKKASRANMILLAVLTALLLLVAWVTDIQTPEHYFGRVETDDTVGTVTLSILCEGEGADDVLLVPTAVPIARDDTVYHALLKACQTNGLTFDMTGSAAIPETVYIRGIGLLYEYDKGPVSGWSFSVNGIRPKVGCGAVKLSDGDWIEWRFVSDLGALFEEEA